MIYVLLPEWTQCIHTIEHSDKTANMQPLQPPHLTREVRACSVFLHKGSKKVWVTLSKEVGRHCRRKGSLEGRSESSWCFDIMFCKILYNSPVWSAVWMAPYWNVVPAVFSFCHFISRLDKSLVTDQRLQGRLGSHLILVCCGRTTRAWGGWGLAAIPRERFLSLSLWSWFQSGICMKTASVLCLMQIRDDFVFHRSSKGLCKKNTDLKDYVQEYYIHIMQ